VADFHFVEGERERFLEALFDGFRSEGDVQRLAETKLDLRYGRLSGDTVPGRLLALINWAESHGRLGELISDAYNEAPGNPQLESFYENVKDRLTSPSLPAPAPGEMEAAVAAQDWTAVISYGRRFGPERLPDHAHMVAKAWQALSISSHILGRHDGAVMCLATTTSPEGSRVLSGSADGTVKVWDLATRKQVGVYIGHAGDRTHAQQSSPGVSALAATANGQYAVSGTDNGALRVWTIEPIQDSRTLAEAGNWGPVSSLVGVPPTGGIVFAAGARGVTGWEVGSGQPIQQVKPSGFVTSVAVMQAGKRLALGMSDGVIRIWTRTPVKESRKMDTLDVYTRTPIVALAAMPDGQTIVTGSSQGILSLWDGTTGKEMYQFGRHEGAVTTVAVAGDHLLVSAGIDGTIRLWDLDAVRNADAPPERRVLRSHDGPIYGVVVADPCNIVSSGRDRTVRVSTFPPGILQTV